MKRRAMIPVLMTFLFMCLVGALAPAEETGADQPEAKVTAEQEKANEKKLEELKKLSGKELYRLRCKDCHTEDSPGGEYTPMTLIQEQWERFFEEQYAETHADVVDSTQGNAKVVDLILPESLEKIYEFCIEGAADSEHPMTCE